MKVLKPIFLPHGCCLLILWFSFTAVCPGNSTPQKPVEWENMGPGVGGSIISENEGGDMREIYQKTREKLNQKTHVEINYKIVLSPEIKKSLKEYNADFKIWKAEDYIPTLIQVYEFKSFYRKDFFGYQTPSALIGDFNGDNVADALLAGHDKIKSISVMVMSKGNKYQVLELEKKQLESSKANCGAAHGIIDGEDGIECGLSAYFELVPPQRIKANPDFDRPEIELKTDAFIIGIFEKASTLYIYKDGKFISYPMSD